MGIRSAAARRRPQGRERGRHPRPRPARQSRPSAARSLAEDYDRDRALTKVAARLARRGLADQAIEAVRASPDFVSFQARDKLGEVARILARHGHGDGALQAHTHWRTAALTTN